MASDEPRFKLNRNAGVDTLHREQTLEECNYDDAEDRQVIDEMTAEAMVADGSARRCEHCKPEIPVEL